MSTYRREIFFNKLKSDPIESTIGTEAYDFHKSLPNYQSTPLISLPDLAVELGVKKVLLKDESSRFGLPSFKILGASWGACRAIMKRLDLPVTSKLEDLKQSVSKPLTLVAATDGNHGRAVAHIASLLDISALIVVPSNLDQHVKDAIASEGAKVIDIDGDYDTAVQKAADMADDEHLLVQDTAWEGYEEIPQWIVQGYSTIFREIADQDPSWSENSIVITPVGVGSLAHGVVQSCKPQIKVVSVEPDTAACLYKNRTTSKLTPIKTSFTIMTGMDCGTVSHTAFNDLHKHVDISLTISDFESHLAVEYLKERGILAGPCGASGVAAARRLAAEGVLDKYCTLILLNTESSREYKIPHDVGTNDPVELTQILTRIESTNVTLSKTPGSGEKEIANVIQAWLQYRDIDTYQVGKDRPSIVGVVKGNGGKSLMINGHIDTVSLDGYIADPLGGNRETRNGREVVTGRGALDMKAGLAIGMCNLARVKHKRLNGDVILCAVADEEDASIGTQQVLAAGWRADAAIIPEPSQTELFIAHKGFVWIELTVHGVAAHGSDPKNGVDAIMQTRLVLNALDEYASKLPTHPDLGQATMHCGTIRGGEENSSYSAECVLTLEFRTIPGQSGNTICDDVEKLLANLTVDHARPRVLLERPAYSLDRGHEFVKSFLDVARSSGKGLTPSSGAFWCDAALLSEKGIPTLIFGPSGEGLHGKDEYVHIDSIAQVDKIMEQTIDRFCG